MSAKTLEQQELHSAEFTTLEEKIYRTIELLKAARAARTAAERDLERVKAQLEEREEETDRMRNELVTLRKEREEVRTRVEKLMAQIDELSE